MAWPGSAMKATRPKSSNPRRKTLPSANWIAVGRPRQKASTRCDASGAVRSGAVGACSTRVRVRCAKCSLDKPRKTPDASYSRSICASPEKAPISVGPPSQCSCGTLRCMRVSPPCTGMCWCSTPPWYVSDSITLPGCVSLRCSPICSMPMRSWVPGDGPSTQANAVSPCAG